MLADRPSNLQFRTGNYGTSLGEVKLLLYTVKHNGSASNRESDIQLRNISMNSYLCRRYPKTFDFIVSIPPFNKFLTFVLSKGNFSEDPMWGNKRLQNKPHVSKLRKFLNCVGLKKWIFFVLLIDECLWKYWLKLGKLEISHVGRNIELEFVFFYGPWKVPIADLIFSVVLTSWKSLRHTSAAFP